MVKISGILTYNILRNFLIKNFLKKFKKSIDNILNGMLKYCLSSRDDRDYIKSTLKSKQ